MRRRAEQICLLCSCDCNLASSSGGFYISDIQLKERSSNKTGVRCSGSLNAAVRRRSEAAHSKVRKQTLESGETGENQVGGDHLISSTQNKSRIVFMFFCFILLMTQNPVLKPASCSFKFTYIPGGRLKANSERSLRGRCLSGVKKKKKLRGSQRC